MSLRPFDLELAKAGHPIQTRDGRKAKFIAHVPECSQFWRVVFLIDGNSGLSCCDESGAMYTWESAADLFMAPRKRTVWVNFLESASGILISYTFDSEKDADDWQNNVSRRPRAGNRAYPVEIEE